MTTSNISATTSPYYQAIDPSSFKQRSQDFKALANALQSGDLSSAQSAFAAFQKDLPSSSQASSSQANSSQPFGQNSQANKDFQTLQNSLASGDISGAQSAFTALKKDLKSAGGVQGSHHHHHHHGSNAAATNSASSTSANTTGSDSSAVNSLLNIQA
jgi:hypothetical protein